MTLTVEEPARTRTRRTYSIIVDFPPQQKERPRINKSTGVVYTPKRTKDSEETIGWIWKRDVPGDLPTFGPGVPLQVEIRAYFKRPVSVKRKYHTVKPDSDNLSKIKDGLNGIAWADDAQIIDDRTCKFYAEGDEKPRVVIIVREVIDPPLRLL